MRLDKCPSCSIWNYGVAWPIAIRFSHLLPHRAHPFFGLFQSWRGPGVSQERPVIIFCASKWLHVVNGSCLIKCVEVDADGDDDYDNNDNKDDDDEDEEDDAVLVVVVVDDDDDDDLAGDILPTSGSRGNSKLDTWRLEVLWGASLQAVSDFSPDLQLVGFSWNIANYQNKCFPNCNGGFQVGSIKYLSILNPSQMTTVDKVWQGIHYIVG